MDRIAQKWPLEPRLGWDRPASVGVRFAEDPKKAERSSATHVVDGIALAANHILHYARHETAAAHGQRWEGTCDITEAPFAIIQHPLWYRRALHDQNPVKGGRRKRCGGTTTLWGFRKGDFVEATKAGWGYVSAIQQRPNKRISL